MATYITLDAGGTKCNAIMFDENLNILGRGLSGGVNLTQTSPEDARANMAECLDKMFEAGCPEHVDGIYVSLVGPVEVLIEELEKRTRLGERMILGEPVAGLLAGGIRGEGMLAIAGTGSDVFYITHRAPRNRRRTVGGFGPILGDQGSGTWIGQMALRAAVKACNGWGRETCLNSLINEAWGTKDEWGMVGCVHGSVAPFRKVASVAPLVGKAAAMGDAVALDIIKGAGDVMAEQALSLIGRNDIPPEDRCMVACGGAWKAHPLMFDTFQKRINAVYPDVEVCKPHFEHVMAGPVKLLLDRGMDREAVLATLKERFADYVIRW